MLSSYVVQGQIYNTEVEAKINLEYNSEFIEIVGSAFNNTRINQSLRYVLSVIKTNPQNSNRSKNDQSGRIVLEPGQKKNLSSTTINSQEKDRIIILLLVYDAKDELLGKDRVVLNGTADEKEEAAAKINSEDSYSQDARYEKEDGVVLRGLVLEETKTKPGRDFYREFWSLYNRNNINAELIVKIKESLSLANNTKIEVFLGDEMILEFIVRPQADFIKAAASEALDRVYWRLKQLREEQNKVQRF
ncbi:MAG: curli production assembly/transport protein CsgE [Altibacter sp.]|nr:curli production assembly/transport protein CsgE [Altibacter sp.]